jgi:hypothetical protein
MSILRFSALWRRVKECACRHEQRRSAFACVAQALPRVCPALTAFLLMPAVVEGQPDLSGVRAYWTVAAILRRGDEPSGGDWDALFATPGYAALQAREGRRPALPVW